jgi:hypothetical protein
MQISPLVLVDAMRESDPYIRTIYTEGGCYRLHLLLKTMWPEARPVINAQRSHVGSLIGGAVYDIDGIVQWSYRGMDSDDIKLAEAWGFAKNSMLQIGECPFCEEPILA